MTNLNFLRFCSFFCLIFTVLLTDAQVNIIPKPMTVKVLEGSFKLNEKTVIQIPVNNPNLRASADFIKNQINTV